MQNDQDMLLVKRVLAQERTGFDEFFEAYFARLTRFCAARMSDTSAVEDIVQETMVKVIRNLHTYRGEAMLFSWMCQICRNEINTWYKKYGRKQEALVSIDDDPAVRAALESFGMELQRGLDYDIALKDLIQLTLDYLPDNYGKALEWKYMEGSSVQEIADRLGMRHLATQSMLARARKAFRACFLDLQQELRMPTTARQR